MQERAPLALTISSEFDGGNIACLDATDPNDIRLAIRKDNYSGFLQWFHFRLSGARGIDCRLRIVNAGAAAYPEGWRGYRAVASYDRRSWFRVETEYDGASLTIRHRPERDSVRYAYFAPYSMERHADLVAGALDSPRAALTVLGRTLDGQDLDLLCIGEDRTDKRVVWAIARQHPGETMAEWWMEGFLRRLLDEGDETVRRLLERCVFRVVPNMNPDGSRRGHLRTNAAGANLNREWDAPTMERSPEVALVRAEMEREGVDLCLDVHGDEALPYVFLAGAEGIAAWSARLADLDRSFRAALLQASPDFQIERGYPVSGAGTANLRMCTNWVAQRFECLALTLEQPFKDNANAPDADEGWSPERSRRLGAACLDAVAAVAGRLR
jgi:murein tripeptide amidase MpaA